MQTSAATLKYLFVTLTITILIGVSLIQIAEAQERGPEDLVVDIQVATQSPTAGHNIGCFVLISCVEEMDSRFRVVTSPLGQAIKVNVTCMGRDVPQTRFGTDAMQVRRRVSVAQSVVKSGENVLIPIHLSRLYDVSVAGEYTLAVDVPIVEVASGVISRIRSETVVVVAEPKPVEFSSDT